MLDLIAEATPLLSPVHADWAVVVAALISGSLFSAIVSWRRYRKTGSVEKDSIIAEAAEKAVASVTVALKQALKDLGHERDARVALERQIAVNQQELNFLQRRVRELEQHNAQSMSIAGELLNAMPNAIIQAGPDGAITRVNDYVAPLFGYEPEELLDKPVPMLMPVRYRHLHRAGFEKAVQTGGEGALFHQTRPSYFKGLHKDGHEFLIALLLRYRKGVYTAVIRSVDAAEAQVVPIFDPADPSRSSESIS